MVQNINPVQTTASSPTEPKCISFHSSRLWPCYTVGKHYLHDRAMMRNRRLLPDYVGLQFAALTLSAFALPCLSSVTASAAFLCELPLAKVANDEPAPRSAGPNCLQGSDVTKLVLWTGEVPNANKPKKGPNVKWTKGLMDYSTMLIWTTRSSVRAPGLSHITRRKVTSPNGIARWRKVTSHGGKSHHFATIPMAQRHSTENRKVTKSSRDIAHSEIFVDFRKKFASNTNGTACAI